MGSSRQDPLRHVFGSAQRLGSAHLDHNRRKQFGRFRSDGRVFVSGKKKSFPVSLYANWKRRRVGQVDIKEANLRQAFSNDDDDSFGC